MDIKNTISSVKGFRVGVADAGLRKQPAPDLTLIASDKACSAAGVFTTNKVQAAPVILDRQVLEHNPDRVHAVLVNAGCANACTGAEGMENARRTAQVAAEGVGCKAEEVLVMSTGVIGTQLPMEKMTSGIKAAAASLREDGWPDAAHAIMTTDTKPKFASVDMPGYRIAGIAKGAGMIAPTMATMLSVIVTDAEIPAFQLYKALRRAAGKSFNRVVIDGDMSTNDTLLILANGASGTVIDEARFEPFSDALALLCIDLAKKIVRDGEGATRFIELRVTGATSHQDARKVADAIATSPLVKTAFYGGDANWGRILAAAGRSGAPLQPERTSLWYNDLQLLAEGTPLGYDDAKANAIASQPEIAVWLDLGMGDGEAIVWTCDLSHDYVSINGHYRT